MPPIPKITPIAWTQIDWPLFIQSTTDVTGRSPTRSLDKSNTEIGTAFSFIAALSEFQHVDSEPWKAVKWASRLLKALSFVFLIEAEKELAISVLQQSDLDVIISDSKNDAFIIIGNLLNFKQSIVDCSAPEKDFELRRLMNLFYIMFTQESIGQIFNKYKRQFHPDNTFSLV